MKYCIYYNYEFRGYAMRSIVGAFDCELEDSVRTFEADSFLDAVFAANEISDDILAHPERIPVVVIDYLEEPVYTSICADYKNYQSLLGGLFEATECPYSENVDILCNEEGKLQKLPLNRGLTCDGELFDIVAGRMILVSTNNDGDTIGLNYEQINDVYNAFKRPEIFFFDYDTTDIHVFRCSIELGKLMKQNKISNISMK